MPPPPDERNRNAQYSKPIVGRNPEYIEEAEIAKAGKKGVEQKETKSQTRRDEYALCNYLQISRGGQFKYA